MKAFFVVVIVILFSSQLKGQTLTKKKLTKHDIRTGVLMKFYSSANDSYGTVELLLMKDRTFLYNLNAIANNGVSQGKWEIANGVLMLQSSLQIDNVPIEISSDSNRRFVYKSNIAIVENTKHELLTDAVVLINEDSIKCLPMIGSCNGSFDRITRVKVVFENGMSSKWITIEGNKNKVAITVLTDVPISRYIVMNKQRFILSGKYLKKECP
ncbi:hypothetical protein [Chitinophaga filiformis]|uniref:DUF3108 domain-containing protein n=1 Tax=Chitinophaga filiformis TaxID=104663 RepID=A0ABY4I8W8_CHIFI|nr:hypothetical protein [Chitinophaga filiformis]UPK72340.1 hypothetical protein MYF79_13680 [Chitinophaga filiformis]